MIRYAKIRDQDISNGPGFRVSVFFQGCNHYCQNCFNPETWNPGGGYIWNEDKQNKVLELCQNDRISGLSLLGGDPFYHFDREFSWHKEERDILKKFVKDFKIQNPNKTIWVWTGYTWEQCIEKNSSLDAEELYDMLKYIDVIVDGLFIEEFKIPNLKWRGSINQKIIDVQKSLHSNNIIPFNI